MNDKFKFIPIGKEAVNIAGFKVSGIFVADTDPEIDLPGFVINRHLAVDSSLREPLPVDGQERYADLSPAQRATLLELISDANRNEESHPVGLWASKFLVRTIERRLLVDNDNDSNVVTALGDLLGCYPTTLAGTEVPAWITGLFHHWAHRHGSSYYFEFWNWAKGLPLIVWRQDDLQYWLNNLVTEGRHLQAEQAYHMASFICGPGAVDGAQQANGEVWRTFRTHFDAQFPGGMPLKQPNTRKRLLYQPRDPHTARALAAHTFKPWVEVADFFKEAGQFAPLSLMLQAGPAKVSGTESKSVPRQRLALSPSGKLQSGSPKFFDEVKVAGATPPAQGPVSAGASEPAPPSNSGSEVVCKSSMSVAELNEARRRNDQLNDRIRSLVGEELLPKRIEVLAKEAADDLVDKLAAGHTPPRFAAILNVGRGSEIEALASDIERISRQQSVFRVVAAPSGLGKTHLRDLNVMMAQQQNLLVVSVDLALAPSIRLAAGSPGYQELVRVMMTDFRLRGANARSGLETLLERIAGQFVSSDGKKQADSDELHARILDRAPQLRALPLGHDFAAAVAANLAATHADHPGLKNHSLRWLSGGKLQASARKMLGVEGDLASGDLVQMLRILAALAPLAGLNGVLLALDEFSILINSSLENVREASFNTLLGVVNAHAQDGLPGAGVLLLGTEDLLDTRRGLLSHESLRTRLGHTSSTHSETGPLVLLSRLPTIELVVLLGRVRDLVTPMENRARLPDEALIALVESKLRRVGAKDHITPRDVLQPFAKSLAQMRKAPAWNWQKNLLQ